MRYMKMRRARVARMAPVVAAAAGLVLAAPGGAAAQVVVNHGALDAARPNIVHLSAGVEYGFIAGVGYSRGFGVGSRTLLVSGSVTAPWAGADSRDHDTRIGATIDIVGWNNLRLIAGLGGTARGTTNRMSRLTSLGADGVLLAGYWSPRWFVAGEGGYDGAIATHVEHTDHYRDLVHPDARDGWYVDTGANIRLGVAGGVSFGRYDLVLRGGQARDRLGRRHLLPAHATLGLNVRF